MALATLSIDLEARLAKMQEGLDRASRLAEQHASRMTAAFERVRVVGAAIGGALVSGLSVSAITDFIQNAAHAATEIERLSQAAGSNSQEFQIYAAGAKSAGMDLDKFADVMKDVQDKIGDFLASGGGELKDFFEKIAPKVGVTADQFRTLSGPQALQLFYSSLEKANVGSKVMVNQLEAIADDASLLIPLLRDNGAEFKKLGDEAQRAGVIMSTDMVKAGVELDKNLKELKRNVEGVGVSINSVLIPAINDMFRAAKSQGSLTDKLFGALGLNNIDARWQGLKASWESISLAVERTMLQRSLKDNPNDQLTLQRIAELDARGKELAATFNQARQQYLKLTDTSAGAGRGFVHRDDFDPPKNDGGTWRPPPEKDKDKKTPEATPAAAAYADAMKQLIEVQQRAQESAAGLTEAEAALQRVMSGAEWANMPAAWRDLIKSQADAANQALGTAAYEKNLKQLSDTVHATAKEVMGLDAAQSALYDLMVSPDWARMTDNQRAEAAARAEQASATLKQLEADKRLVEIRKQMLELAEKYKDGYFGQVGSKEAIEGFSEAAQKNIGIEKTKDEFEELKQAIEGFGRDSAAAIVDFAITGKNSFGDLVNSMIADIARLIVYRTVTQPLFNAIGASLPSFSFGAGAGGGASAGGDIAGPGLKLQASGGVWNQGIQRFAAGGVFSNSIVDQPTLFRHTGGLGEMGEAGPEAIMPLRPAAAGGLGVIADLGNGQTVVPVARMPSGQLGINLQRIEHTMRALASDVAPQRFATGGVFSNSIVDQPTLFRHAGGLGEMGEAGPEAVMPLQPSAAGGLGVIAELGNVQTVVPVARMPGGKLGISLQRIEHTMRALASDTAPQRFATGGVFGAVQTPAPLPRLADGRLLAAPRQAAADGGISGVVVNNYTGQQVQQRSVPDGRGGRRIEVAIGEMVAGEMRRPGSALHQSAQAGFGLRPALVGR